MPRRWGTPRAVAATRRDTPRTVSRSGWSLRPRVDPNELPVDGPHGLVAVRAAVPARRHRRGVRHPLAPTLAVAVLGPWVA